MNDLGLMTSSTLIHSEPASENAAAVYLASLTSAHSRRNMRRDLDTMAAALSGNRADAFSLEWGVLRFQHTAAVRAVLAERYSPATANHMLSALRGVLKTAWKLGQMSAEDYHRAADIRSVAGS